MLEKVVLFNRLELFNRFISFHSHFSGFSTSLQALYDIFSVFSDLTGNGKRVLRTGSPNRNVCVPFAQVETRWVFDVNGKQPSIPVVFRLVIPLYVINK